MSDRNQHISIKRAAAFLLSGAELEPWEEEHLFNCDECHEATVTATSTELGKGAADFRE